MAHCFVTAADEILDKKFKVLDKGFVRLIDYMGSDERIVQSARVSYGKGTKTIREDKGLINYLLRNDHTSPFEQVVFTFHVKLPIFVARQWIRHRTARVNEISGRYSIMKAECYLPSPRDIATQSSDNKQGRSSQRLPENKTQKILEILKSDQELLYKHYEDFLGHDLARELARINLPLSLYTEWYWQIDLHNLMHFLALRMDPHAQKEIRDYAVVMHKIACRVCPLAMEAFSEHKLNSIKLSQTEVGIIHDLLLGRDVDAETKQYRSVALKFGLESI